jgi:hypothetical protein
VPIVKKPFPSTEPHKIPHSTAVIVYSSWTMRYALASFLNLLILGVGIAIGFMLAPHLEKPVQATVEPQAAVSQPTPQAAPTSGEPKITTVSPSLNTGTVGIYLVLAHHVQSDELVVNGYDILRLQNEELSLLSRFVPAVEIQMPSTGREPQKYSRLNNPNLPSHRHRQSHERAMYASSFAIGIFPGKNS